MEQKRFCRIYILDMYDVWAWQVKGTLDLEVHSVHWHVKK